LNIYEDRLIRLVLLSFVEALLLLSPVTPYHSSLAINMVSFTSFVITALMSVNIGNAAPLVQERCMLMNQTGVWQVYLQY
jgi:hypothetical protein